MKDTYGLKQVMFPEDKHLDPKYHSMPRCPIFMSSGFIGDQKELKERNKERSALVLI